MGLIPSRFNGEGKISLPEMNYRKKKGGREDREGDIIRSTSTENTYKNQSCEQLSVLLMYICEKQHPFFVKRERDMTSEPVRIFDNIEEHKL